MNCYSILLVTLVERSTGPAAFNLLASCSYRMTQSFVMLACGVVVLDMLLPVNSCQFQNAKCKRADCSAGYCVMLAQTFTERNTCGSCCNSAGAVTYSREHTSEMLEATTLRMKIGKAIESSSHSAFTAKTKFALLLQLQF